MLKFNNNDNFTGYLKQLLSSFNLPKCKVYTEDWKVIGSIMKPSAEVFPNHMRYIPYLKDDYIQFAERNGRDITWKQTNKSYFFGQKLLNTTKNLAVQNNIYDTYTHEYLGDYLRFIRDYRQLNLMPLYNCFSNEVCQDLSLKFKVSLSEEEKKDVIFNSYDEHYKIYMLPVKLFEHYTIAIDSDQPVEVCCGLYGKYQDKREKFKDVYAKTYKCYSKLSFRKPVIYSRIYNLISELSPSSDAELAQNECDLKMFIKLPISNTSTITILEGDYREWLNLENHFITNYEGPAVNKQHAEEEKYNDHIGFQEDQYFNPITSLQLLKMNTQESYPFADRLIEYLMGNTVNKMDENGDNIIRAQRVLKLNGVKSDVEGLWFNKMQHALYDGQSKQHLDTFGYVDKDIEKEYSAKIGNSSVTISNINIYEEDE